MKDILKKIPNWTISIYIVWFSVNLIFLFIGKKADYSREYFIPFSKYGDQIARYYDYTEFIIYITMPIFLVLAFILVQSGKSKQPRIQKVTDAEIIKELQEEGIVGINKKGKPAIIMKDKDSVLHNIGYAFAKSFSIIIKLNQRLQILEAERIDKPNMEETELENAETEAKINFNCPCINCGENIYQNDIFCSFCGARQTQFCMGCGEFCGLPIKDEDEYSPNNFCDSCRYDLFQEIEEPELEYCSHCGNQISVDWNYCRSCGKKTSRFEL